MAVANRKDARRFFNSQAIPRTYMGVSPETGPSGYNKRLAAVPQVTVGFTLNNGLTTPQIVGDLPAGFILGGDFLNYKVTTGTVKLELAAKGALPAIILVAAAALTDAADRQGLTIADLIPLPVDRTLVATVTGGVAGQVALCALNGYILDNGWF